MVLKNLFTGQQWRNRHREQTYGHGRRRREERMRCMERVTQTSDILYLICGEVFIFVSPLKLNE